MSSQHIGPSTVCCPTPWRLVWGVVYGVITPPPCHWRLLLLPWSQEHCQIPSRAPPNRMWRILCVDNSKEDFSASPSSTRLGAPDVVTMVEAWVSRSGSHELKRPKGTEWTGSSPKMGRNCRHTEKSSVVDPCKHRPASLFGPWLDAGSSSPGCEQHAALDVAGASTGPARGLIGPNFGSGRRHRLTESVEFAVIHPPYCPQPR